MTDPLVDALRDAGVERVHGDASLASLTTLKVGGPARVLVVAERDADLAAVGEVSRTHGVAWTIVGRGSNLLVSDDGWPGVVIQLGRAYRGVEEAAEGWVVAGAAEPLPALARAVARAGYGGFAWACAVPGNLGGAVRMNAGAHGGELSQSLRDVEVVRLGTGARERVAVADLGLGYRRSALPADAVVVSARLELAPADPAEVREEMAAIRDWRRAHQPLAHPNCGSVFANPPGDSAGRLIEASGAKGLRVGGAAVSERHANFIVTSRGATARDVACLIELVRERVEQQHGVRLTEEVVRLGTFAPCGHDHAFTGGEP